MSAIILDGKALAASAKALATHHGFQQKTVLATVFGKSQFEVERQRGFQIGKRLGHEGNAVVALQGQAFVFEFGDHREPPQLSPTGAFNTGKDPSEGQRRVGRPRGKVQCARTARSTLRRQGQAPRSLQPVMVMRCMNMARSVTNTYLAKARERSHTQSWPSWMCWQLSTCANAGTAWMGSPWL